MSQWRTIVSALSILLTTLPCFAAIAPAKESKCQLAIGMLVEGMMASSRIERQAGSSSVINAELNAVNAYLEGLAQQSCTFKNDYDKNCSSSIANLVRRLPTKFKKDMDLQAKQISAEQYDRAVDLQISAAMIDVAKSACRAAEIENSGRDAGS